MYQPLFRCFTLDRLWQSVILGKMAKGLAWGTVVVDRIHVFVLGVFVFTVGTHFFVIEFLSWFVSQTESLSSMTIAPLLYALKKTQLWLFGKGEWFKFVPFFFGVDLFLLLVREFAYEKGLRFASQKIEASLGELPSSLLSLPILQKKWQVHPLEDKVDLTRLLRSPGFKWKLIKKEGATTLYRAKQKRLQRVALPFLFLSWFGLIYVLTLEKTPVVRRLSVVEGQPFQIPSEDESNIEARLRCDADSFRCRIKIQDAGTFSSTSFYSKQIFQWMGGIWVLDQVVQKGWRVDLEVLQPDGARVQKLRNVTPGEDWIDLEGARFRVAKIEREMEVPSSLSSTSFGDSLEIEYEEKNREPTRRTVFEKFPKYDQTLHKKKHYYFLMNEVKPEMKLHLRIFDSKKSLGLLIAAVFAILGFLLMARGPLQRYWLFLRGSTLCLMGWCVEDAVLQHQMNRIENSIQGAKMATPNEVQH